MSFESFAKTAHHALSFRGITVATGLKLGAGFDIEHHMKKNGHGEAASLAGGTVGGVVVGGGIAYAGVGIAGKYGAIAPSWGKLQLTEQEIKDDALSYGMRPGREASNGAVRAIQKTFTSGQSLASVREDLQRVAKWGGGKDSVTAWKVVRGALNGERAFKG